MDKTGDKSIVCWQPHGRAFMVHKPKEFVQEVMSHFFNQTKYASFQRQLNLYGFSRLTHGPDKGAYYHNCFVRGKRHLCKGMIRQKIKGTKVRKSLSPEDEPNFYIENQHPVLTQFFNPPEKFCQQNIESIGQSSSSQQSSVDESPDTASSMESSQILSSEASLVSLVSIAPLDPFKTSNTISRSSKPYGGMNNKPTNKTYDLLPNNITSLSVPRIVSPQHTASYDTFDECLLPTPAGIIKGGDLLFFEGQPFRYLEHFEEVPANQHHTVKKIDNNTNGKLTLKISTTKRGKYSQTTCDTTTSCNDAFHNRISKIIFNIDSSRSFQNEVMQNTPCTV